MSDLFPCRECSELLVRGSEACPWCAAEQAPGLSVPPRSVLFGMGLVMLAGCSRGQAVYGVPCTDSGGCGPGTIESVAVLSWTGTVDAVTGNPFGLDSAVVGTWVDGELPFQTDAEDADPDVEIGHYSGDTQPLVLHVANRTINGTGAFDLVLTDQATDSLRYEDSGTFNNEPDGMTATSPTASMSLEITDDSGAMLAGDALPTEGFQVSSTLPHTFEVTEGGGVLSIQLSTMTVR